MDDYPAPAFQTPEPYGFLYLGFHADPPQRLPLYRQTAGRRSEAARLATAAKAISGLPEVVSVRVFRAVLIPPLPGAPRHDLAMLIRTTGVDQLQAVRTSDAVTALGGEAVLAGANAAKIGETEASDQGTFLFNHFTVESAAEPTEIWRGFTGWYTEKTGIDNSTALESTQPAQFSFVNYARLPGPPFPFLINQLARPSFHRFVRATLKANGMRALPAFYRVVSTEGP
ncbi:hypothetical protein AB0J84_19660 [Micromonospora arborensis]|uniref:hypothetical protein n=1 Tax=Micromonospora arborensis TaxID=2116518 RepID=UPI0034359AF0